MERPGPIISFWNLTKPGIRGLVQGRRSGRCCTVPTMTARGSPPPYAAPPRGERAWDRPALARLHAAYRKYGLELAVIEDTAPMDAVRLGTAAATSRSPGRAAARRHLRPTAGLARRLGHT